MDSMSGYQHAFFPDSAVFVSFSTRSAFLWLAF
jgi:hypothetical protein